MKKSHIRKTLAMLLMLALAFTFAACGNSDSGDEGSEANGVAVKVGSRTLPNS